jgi:hypothetical protein
MRQQGPGRDWISRDATCSSVMHCSPDSWLWISERTIGALS